MDIGPAKKEGKSFGWSHKRSMLPRRNRTQTLNRKDTVKVWRKLTHNGQA